MNARSLVAPIHVEAVGLGKIRFFVPPSGGREFSWVSLDDAMHCFSMPRGMRRQATRDLQREWKGDTVTVATADGIVLLIPHYMAQGMAHAMTECGRADADLYWKYAMGGTRALGKLLPGVDGDYLLSYLRDAVEAGGGAG